MVTRLQCLIAALLVAAAVGPNVDNDKEPVQLDKPPPQQQDDTVTVDGDTGTPTNYTFSDGNYSPMFAITFGVFIGMALIVVFVTVGMLSIDPSKDSLIYRMTTTRMKKDS